MTIYLHHSNTGITAFYWVEYADGSFRKLTKAEGEQRDSTIQWTPYKQYPKQPKKA